ncbi:MAG: TetR/AcrR family transcriptional regulator [Sphingobacteriaceae bacterium]|nr:TetR/AcrR family transcriptional regulator [Sphingobacteriaceae bacterium]
MQLDVRIKMNEKLYLRNPEDSTIGKRIVSQGLILINKLGFEDFTFKKLAIEIETTEATIYRYFENKHRLLVYLTTWWWSFLEYKVMFSLNNINDPQTKLKTIITLLVSEPNKNQKTDYIKEYEAYNLVKWESSKAYLTRSVTKDNKDRLFKPYKDLCGRISQIIKEYNPKYKYPNYLASTLLEMSHAQKFFMENLPLLTDSSGPDEKKLIQFLEHVVFSSLKN